MTFILNREHGAGYVFVKQIIQCNTQIYRNKQLNNWFIKFCVIRNINAHLLYKSSLEIYLTILEYLPPACFCGENQFIICVSLCVPMYPPDTSEICFQQCIHRTNSILARCFRNYRTERFPSTPSGTMGNNTTMAQTACPRAERSEYESCPPLPLIPLAAGQCIEED